MDDYEFGCSTYADAEYILAVLQEVMNDYELQLNPNKTSIIELPEAIESNWASELRIFNIRGDVNSQKYDLIRYFNRSFELSKLFPRQPVLKYAVSRLIAETIKKENWELFQHLLYQSATSEPGTLSFVIDQIKFYVDAGYSLDSGTLSSALSSIILNNAPLGHGSEVAWALWGAILLGVPIDSSAVAVIAKVEDSIVALLSLDANSQGLFKTGFSSPLWEGLMTPDELKDEQWLLAYEANRQGWLTGVGGKDNVANVPAFKFLKDEGVYFYDKSRSSSYKPRKTLLSNWLSNAVTIY